MMVFEEIKAMFVSLNWKDLRTLSKIKKKIKKGQKEVKIENIDLVGLKDKNLFNEYIISLSKKYPDANFYFINSSIDGLDIELVNDIKMSFEKCYITNLNIESNNKNIISFNKCKLLYCDTEKNQIRIKTNKIEMDECEVNIKTNANHLLELGNGVDSKVSIKNQSFKNFVNVPFNIYICTEILTLSKYKSVDNIKLVVSRGKNAINYIDMLDSNVEFNENAHVDVNMILSDNSNICNLTTESESIEISNNCTFKNSNIKSNNMLINGDASLSVIDSDLNIQYLECSENSEINDITNKFSWLKNIRDIAANKGFKLKYNNETIYTKENNQEVDDDYQFEEIIEHVEEKTRSMR